MTIHLYDRPMTFYHWLGKDSPVLETLPKTSYRVSGNMLVFNPPLTVNSDDVIMSEVSIDDRGVTYSSVQILKGKFVV